MKTENNSQFIGNQRVVKFLKRLVKLNQNGQLSGSYVFTGPSHVGKTSLTNFFVQSLLCQQSSLDGSPCGKCQVCKQLKNNIYADVVKVVPAENKRDISIEQIKILINKLKMSSFANSYKIGIIYQAHKLNQKSANALLKTLEEPNQRVLIFLITDNIDYLPATIVSRSQVLNFYPVSVDEIYNHLVNNYQANRSLALNIAHLAAGRPGLAINLFNNQKILDNNFKIAEIFLQTWEQDINQRLDSLSQIVPEKFTGKDAVNSAHNIINIWGNTQRDLWLAKYNQKDLIHYRNFINKLDELKNIISKKDLIKTQQLLDQAKEYLFSNVNPRIALENVIINI